MGLIVDLFAGGGGASTGIEMALGRSPDIAINHDPEALAMHRANHPATRHLCASVLKVLPLEATGGAKVDVLHASPDCTHFSKAKGGKPRSQFIRDLAWVVIRWAEDTRPTLISLENVEEFQTWGPLDRSGQPIKEQAGATFRAWVRRLRRLGYKVSWRELRACDFGAPTTRKRLFVMARCDGKPIVWPRPTHGDPNSEAVRSGRLLPWRTAAECIDWSLPTQSIFARKKPLADNTLRRIAEGIRRYVLQAPAPFLVSYYGTKGEKDFRGSGLDVPLRTQTTENRFALVTPFLQHMQHSKAKNGTMPIGEPMRTITATPKGGGISFVAAHMTKFNTGSVGYACDEPVHTVVAGGKQKRPGTAITQGIATANLVKMRGTNIGSPADAPLHTVSAQGLHHALMTATLIGAGGPTYAGEPVSVEKPFGVILPKHSRALVTASICKYYGKSEGSDLDSPLHTLSSREHMGLMSACMVKYNGTALGSPVDDPIHTITSKARMGFVTAPLTPAPCSMGRYLEVRAFLRERGVIGADAEAEVIIDGETYRITDICLRMLKPRELYRAQGFSDTYIIAPMHEGKPLTITAQVRMCGNSVPPQFVAALVRANGPDTWAVPKLVPALPLLHWAGQMTARARPCSVPA